MVTNKFMKTLGRRLLLILGILVIIASFRTIIYRNKNTNPDFSKGWYWGSENQKKSGTPDDWIYQEAGKSSCWHKAEVNCNFFSEPTKIENTYKCPENNWVDCMPGPDKESRQECSDKYQQWAKVNCPNYKGIAY